MAVDIFIFFIGGVAAFGLLLIGLVLLAPAASQAVERVRLERETAEASWRIHQAATTAFGRMLDAARQTERGGDSPDRDGLS